jgi:hypothetical protein
MQPALFPLTHLASVDGAKLIDGCWPMRSGSNFGSGARPSG